MIAAIKNFFKRLFGKNPAPVVISASTPTLDADKIITVSVPPVTSLKDDRVTRVTQLKPRTGSPLRAARSETPAPRVDDSSDSTALMFGLMASNSLSSNTALAAAAIAQDDTPSVSSGGGGDFGGGGASSSYDSGSSCSSSSSSDSSSSSWSSSDSSSSYSSYDSGSSSCSSSSSWD